MNSQEILDTLTYTLRMYEDFENYTETFRTNVESLTEIVSKEEDELKIVQESAIYYKKSQDIIYEKSIGALKELINSALRFVFYDKNYEIAINLEDKRGTKNLSFGVKDLDKDDFMVNLRNGCGNGVRSVVSAILNLFILINEGSNKLILDEKYSHVSADYIPSFMKFLEEICERKNITLVLITHDDRFLPYSKKTYRVTDGLTKDVTDN